MANRTISAAGIALIKRFEGCRLTAYKCSAGVWTIGYGHTSGVYAGMRITQAQAEAFFQADCRKFGSYVNNSAYVPQTEQLNQNQFDALVSFVFNLGQKWLKSLCDNGRTLAQIAAAMPQYRRAAGQVLPGLVQRRAAEVALFNTPVTTAPASGGSTAHPTELPAGAGLFCPCGQPAHPINTEYTGKDHWQDREPRGMQQGNDQRQQRSDLDEYFWIRKRGMDLRRHGRKEFCVLRNRVAKTTL